MVEERPLVVVDSDVSWRHVYTVNFYRTQSQRVGAGIAVSHRHTKLSLRSQQTNSTKPQPVATQLSRPYI